MSQTPMQLAFACCDALAPGYDTDPYLDKIGGVPVFPALACSTPAHKMLLNSLVCSRGHGLVLVAQLWAKTASHFDRFIYIFGCNMAECSSHNSSWKVLRCIKPTTRTITKAASAEPSISVSSDTAFQAPQTKLFSFGSDGIDEWEEDEAAIDPKDVMFSPSTAAPTIDFDRPLESKSTHDGYKAPVAEVADVMALLHLRDSNYNSIKTISHKQIQSTDNSQCNPTEPNAGITSDLAKNDSATKQWPATPSLHSDVPAYMLNLAFPAFQIEFESEPTTEEDTYMHEMSLLQAYRSANPSDAAYFEPNGKQLLSNESFRKTNDNSGNEWLGETYEAMGLGVDKLFKRFQRTVHLASEQCIRYSLKGTPLWYKANTTQSELSSGHIPICERCGAKRVFECQLMPNILNILKVDTHVSSRDATPLAHVSSDFSATTKEEDGGKIKPQTENGAHITSPHFGSGMDWGTVYVFLKLAVEVHSFCENSGILLTYLPILVETGIESLLTRSLISRVRLLERSVTKKTPINAICSGTDNDVFTLNVQGQLVRSQCWFWSRRTKQLYRNRYWLTPQVRPKTVKQRHSFALMETLQTCGDSASLQKYVNRQLLDTSGFFKDPIDHCILCDQQLLSTSIAHLVVECEQVTGHRIQSGLVPAIQKSRLRLLGRALDPGVENVYTRLRGGVLNGEADLDQRLLLDGTVEHESMGTRHDNRVLAARLADFLQVAYRQYQSTLWKYHRDRLVEVG
ncbi:hypothetical protein BASA62_003043 [Batrachochytrium salamandrivorans]|nr:hypothetical protein BASA62_003043 [Batrachochytrium salamandrivorans]